MKALLLSIVLTFICSTVFGQGITNNGAYIKSTAGSYIKVTGAGGNFANKINGMNIGLVDIGGNLQVSGNLNLYPKSQTTINGTCIVSGNMNIYADATGSGSLIDYGTLSVSGVTNAQLFLPLSSRYYYVSSPVTGATASSFNDIATTDFLYYRNTAASQWVRITNPATAIQPLTGYATKQNANNETVVLTGAFNTGNKTATIVNSGDKWNLIGNPYPSAIDYGCDNDPVNGWTRSNIRNTIYVKHGPVFATWNTAGDGTGTNDGSRYIQAGQSFWVKATGAATFSMSNLVRVHQGNPLLKNNPFCYQLRIKLTGNSISDEAIVRFHQESDDSFDKFDAEKYLVTEPNVPQIWSLLENEKMTINTYSQIPDYKTVNLVHSTGSKGNFVLSFSESETFPEPAIIYLHDKLLNKYVNLRTASTYEFTSESMKETNRFDLIFSNGLVHFDPYESKPLSLENTNNQIDIYSSGKSVIIKSNYSIEGIARIYNLLGKEMLIADLSGNYKQIDMNATPGYYLVKVIDKKGIITRKVHIE